VARAIFSIAPLLDEGATDMTFTTNTYHIITASSVSIRGVRKGSHWYLDLARDAGQTLLPTDWKSFVQKKTMWHRAFKLTGLKGATVILGGEALGVNDNYGNVTSVWNVFQRFATRQLHFRDRDYFITEMVASSRTNTR